jgi:CxxC motif-containing protein (DUF1111 family)
MASRFRPAYLIVPALAIPLAWKVYEAVTPAKAPEPPRPEAVEAGLALFNHNWTVKDPLAGGDGLGPVFNARSCVECHFQGGAGGGGTVEKNVTVYGLRPEVKTVIKDLPHIGVVHAKATKPEYQETLAHVAANLPGTPCLPLEKIIDPSFVCTTGNDVVISQRNTPALFGDGQLDMIPEDELHKAQRQNSTAARLVGLSRAKDPSVRGRVARLPDGRLGRFGWKAEFATLREFVKAACANEIGLSNPDRPQARPMAHREVQGTGTDLSDAQCALMTDFIRGLEAPHRVESSDPAERERIKKGEETFVKIGCADCHTPDLGSIKGFYSDLLLHDLGGKLSAGVGSYGEAIAPPNSTTIPVASEWKTPALWGVADSAPYMHDGRAETLRDAIELHEGESSGVTTAFKNLSPAEQDSVIAFLNTLKAPKSSTTVSPGAVATRTASR